MDNIFSFTAPEKTEFAVAVQYQVGVYAVAASLVPRMLKDAKKENDSKLKLAALQLVESFSLLEKALESINADTPLPLRKRKGRPRNKYVVNSDESNIRVEVLVQWFAHRAYVTEVAFYLRKRSLASSAYVWRRIFGILREPRYIKMCRYL